MKGERKCKIMIIREYTYLLPLLKLCEYSSNRPIMTAKWSNFRALPPSYGTHHPSPAHVCASVPLLSTYQRESTLVGGYEAKGKYTLSYNHNFYEILHCTSIIYLPFASIKTM